MYGTTNIKWIYRFVLWRLLEAKRDVVMEPTHEYHHTGFTHRRTKQNWIMELMDNNKLLDSDISHILFVRIVQHGPRGKMDRTFWIPWRSRDCSSFETIRRKCGLTCVDFHVNLKILNKTSRQILISLDAWKTNKYTKLFVQFINLYKTKRRPLHLKTQSVPRCKHFSSLL
jgi:hypothetical protein